MSKNSPNVLLSADDGIYSQGIKNLARAIHERQYNLTVIAPRSQRSGGGKAITFDEPIRIEKIPLPYLDKKHGYRITGTPADAVIHAIHERSQQKDKSPYDLVVSGINAGENTSIHAVLTSGTCAIAFEAALLGYPAIAFSLDVKDNFFFDEQYTVKEFGVAAEIACDLINKVIQNEGLPEGIAFLNVNFPDNVTQDTPIEIVGLSPKKYNNYTIRKEDPRGVEYFWIWGDRLEVSKGTDAYAVREKKVISITPITLQLSADISKNGMNLEFLIK
jgi:5'-nucleotidase